MTPTTLTKETRYRVLQYLEENPRASQRELALHLGVSLGKVNYCLHALIDKGLLKVRNFRSSANKLAYGYYLTPKGLDEKVSVTYEFLQLKMAEYDALTTEIERLHREIAAGVRMGDEVAND